MNLHPRKFRTLLHSHSDRMCFLSALGPPLSSVHLSSCINDHVFFTETKRILIFKRKQKTTRDCSLGVCPLNQLVVLSLSRCGEISSKKTKSKKHFRFTPLVLLMFIISFTMHIHITTITTLPRNTTFFIFFKIGFK